MFAVSDSLVKSISVFEKSPSFLHLHPVPLFANVLCPLTAKIFSIYSR